jgi:hypothetical protein
LDGAAKLNVKEFRIFCEQGAKIRVTYERSKQLHELLHNRFPEHPETRQNHSEQHHISQQHTQD